MRTYKNPIPLPEPELKGKERIWSGVGDPFVYRFNGKYYLYPSAGPDGIIAWESEDLVYWKCLGVVLDDPIAANAYAPEIYYFNGTFYLITSPRGEGHYLYTSDGPTGPFERLTDNFGLTIDGSIFADDDGTCMTKEMLEDNGENIDPTKMNETELFNYIRGEMIH